MEMMQKKMDSYYTEGSKVKQGICMQTQLDAEKMLNNEKEAAQLQLQDADS